ncbi:hypothetical protein [Acetobacter sp.]|uniref:hypothetical protein n=1 Tax=Acetobacter sp. TaxID=440 RepID=UPI00258BF952|nr:hypothetical protein [Acetobacter sp.]
MSMQSQDIIRRSATNGMTPAPQARSHQEEVAKLIDVSLCTGCKGCQMGWTASLRHRCAIMEVDKPSEGDRPDES